MEEVYIKIRHQKIPGSTPKICGNCHYYSVFLCSLTSVHSTSVRYRGKNNDSPTENKTINIDPSTFKRTSVKNSVADTEWFIPDPALNFESSGSNLGYLSIYGIITKTPKIQLKRRIYQLSAIFCICSFFVCWIRNINFGSRQKFRIHVDPDPQHC